MLKPVKLMLFCHHRDADDAVQDKDGKDMDGGRVRVELARDPRDRRDRDRSRDRGRGFGGRDRDGGRGRRGNPPGPKTNYRLVVENISSRTSWQVRRTTRFFCEKATWHLMMIPFIIWLERGELR